MSRFEHDMRLCIDLARKHREGDIVVWSMDYLPVAINALRCIAVLERTTLWSCDLADLHAIAMDSDSDERPMRSVAVAASKRRRQQKEGAKPDGCEEAGLEVKMSYGFGNRDSDTDDMDSQVSECEASKAKAGLARIHHDMAKEKQVVEGLDLEPADRHSSAQGSSDPPPVVQAAASDRPHSSARGSSDPPPAVMAAAADGPQGGNDPPPAADVTDVMEDGLEAYDKYVVAGTSRCKSVVVDGIKIGELQPLAAWSSGGGYAMAAKCLRKGHRNCSRARTFKPKHDADINTVDRVLVKWLVSGFEKLRSSTRSAVGIEAAAISNYIRFKQQPARHSYQ